MATSILNRKRDLLYLVYFLLHIPIMFRKLSLSSLQTFSAPTTAHLFLFSPTHHLLICFPFFPIEVIGTLQITGLTLNFSHPSTPSAPANPHIALTELLIAL
jgi:hypothetical protein